MKKLLFLLFLSIFTAYANENDKEKIEEDIVIVEEEDITTETAPEEIIEFDEPEISEDVPKEVHED